ncbi:MAG: hypothetical protein C5B52_15555 [Bacteroidetes bacterium]|nr:MAG: hypothetical protein C5B52_15555 [Bacteroidota bacterium]
MRLTKPLLLLVFSLAALKICAQIDTNALKKIYDRAIDMPETKADSILYFADYIQTQSEKLHFDKGAVLSERLRGISAELKGDFETAIKQYLKCLELARALKSNIYESSALTDLGFLYVNTNNPQKAKEFYLQAAGIDMSGREIISIERNFNNLGGIYNKLHQPDSALYFLQKAEEVSKPYADKMDLSSMYNNFGNAYFAKKQWDKALSFFQRNYVHNLADGNRDMLWYDCLNMADVYIEKVRFDSAMKYLDLSRDLAMEMESKSKQADVTALYAKYYSRKGDYKTGYAYFEKWRDLDAARVNEETQQQITDLQERFNVKEKVQQNALLEAQVEKQILRSRNVTIAAVGVGLFAIGVAFSFILIRRKNQKLEEQNELIQKQNEKLSELNAEKNSLISVVSHDLNGPFTSIKMWNQILQSDVSNLSSEQLKALARIESSAENGEKLIRNILDVEKAETNRHKISLENFDLKIFIEDVINAHIPEAKQKDISLMYEAGDKSVYIMSDRHLVNRICENLLSNAIKFTPRGKTVWIGVSDAKDAAHIKFRDEGVGIPREELPKLFSKYSNISSKPTEGEASTGLGLSIVKRLVEELNGNIQCESEPGHGSLFTVILRK